jgi:glyoxylase-like metal-dependent hydrolase (beta-lactamase superfamily II)
MLVRNPPVQVADRFLMLGTSEYPLYLYRGDREGLLFEGGTGAMGPLVAEQLKRLAIPPDFIRQAVVTHAHPDHVMAVPALRAMFPGIAVLGSAAAARTLESPKAMGFFRQVDEALTGALLKAGRIREEHRPAPLPQDRIAIDRTIGEGDTVAVGANAAFQVLATPGHSECSLSFHEPKARILVISDATGYYMPDEKYWWPNYFTGYGAYLDSMRRLAGLGAEALAISHNAAVTGAADVAAYFAGALAATEAYHARIVAETKAGKAVREIAEELGAEVHARAGLLALEFFQKNCGVLVKQSLRQEGMLPCL